MEKFCRAWSWRGSRISSLSRHSTMGPQRPLSLCGRNDAVAYCPPSLLPEDAPVDFLEGWMDLTVVLPSKKFVRMSVERRTPMMDLLIQVTTAHKINPGGHVIQVMNVRSDDYLYYKPSTPIGENRMLKWSIKLRKEKGKKPALAANNVQGALDTSTIHIIPKQKLGVETGMTSRKVPIKALNLPFESTYRLQIRLPKNQLYVLRVSPKTTIQEVLTQTCREKGFDEDKFEICHPDHLDEKLIANFRLGDYQLTEVALVSVNRKTSRSVSTSDILKFQQLEQLGPNSSLEKVSHLRRAPQSHTGKTRSSAGDSSLSSGSLHDGSRGDETPERSFSPFDRQRIMASTPDLSRSTIDGSVISNSVNRMKKRRAPPPPSALRPMDGSQRQVPSSISIEVKSVPSSNMSVISVGSINSNGKKRKAPVPPRQVTTSGPLPNVCAIPEETPVLLTHESSSSALQKAIPKPAPAPRTSLETGIRPASDNESRIHISSDKPMKNIHKETSKQSPREKKKSPVLDRKPDNSTSSENPSLPIVPPPEKSNTRNDLKETFELDSYTLEPTDLKIDAGYGSLESKPVLRKSLKGNKGMHHLSLESEKKPPLKPPRVFSSMTIDESIESAFSDIPILIDEMTESSDDCKDSPEVPSRTISTSLLKTNNRHDHVDNLKFKKASNTSSFSEETLDNEETRNISKDIVVEVPMPNFRMVHAAQVGVNLVPAKRSVESGSQKFVNHDPETDEELLDNLEFFTPNKSNGQNDFSHEKELQLKLKEDSKHGKAEQANVDREEGKQLINEKFSISRHQPSMSKKSENGNELAVGKSSQQTLNPVKESEISLESIVLVDSKDPKSGLTEEEKDLLEKAFAEKELQLKLQEDFRKEKAEQAKLRRKEEERLKNEKLSKSRHLPTISKKSESSSQSVMSGSSLRHHLKNIVGVNLNKEDFQEDVNFKFSSSADVFQHQRSHSSSEDDISNLVVKDSLKALDDFAPNPENSTPTHAACTEDLQLQTNEPTSIQSDSDVLFNAKSKAISDALEESFAQIIDFEDESCSEEENELFTENGAVEEKKPWAQGNSSESSADLKLNFSDSEDDYPATAAHDPPSGFKDFLEEPKVVKEENEVVSKAKVNPPLKFSIRSYKDFETNLHKKMSSNISAGPDSDGLKHEMVLSDLVEAQVTDKVREADPVSTLEISKSGSEGPPPLPLKSDLVRAVQSKNVEKENQLKDNEITFPIFSHNSPRRVNNVPLVVTKPYIPERVVRSFKASSTSELDKSGFELNFAMRIDSPEKPHSSTVNLNRSGSSIHETLAAIKRDILNQQDWKGQEIDTQSKHHVLNRSSSEEKTTSNDFDLKKNLDRTSENRPFLRSNIQKKMQDISVPVSTWTDRSRTADLKNAPEKELFVRPPLENEKRGRSSLSPFNITPRPWVTKSSSLNEKADVMAAARKPSGIKCPDINKYVDVVTSKSPPTDTTDIGDANETMPQFYFGQSTNDNASNTFLGQLQTAIEKVKRNEALTHPKSKPAGNQEELLNQNNLSIITIENAHGNKKASSISPGLSSTVSSLSSPTSSLSSSTKDRLLQLNHQNNNYQEEDNFVPKLRQQHNLSSSHSNLASFGQPQRKSVPAFGIHAGLKEEPNFLQNFNLRAFKRETTGKPTLKPRPLSSLFDVQDVETVARPPPPPIPPPLPSNSRLIVSLKPVNGEIPQAPKLRHKGRIPAATLTPREELLEAIRGKGGFQGLKKTKQGFNIY